MKPETPKEEGWWGKASPWVHGALGVASFVPGLSVVTGAVDAGIYAAEGDMVEAGLSAASMIPGGKVVTTAGKLAKGAANLAKGAHAAEEAAKAAKVAKEAEEAAKLAREAEEAAKLKKAEEEAAKLKKAEEEAARLKQAEREAGAGAGGGKDGFKVKRKKPGPCDHLRQGNGKGPYRGGAHSKTSKPANDGKDSHHMPADDVSPLARNGGPAIQMEPKDHKLTKSNGSQPGSAKYRAAIEALLQEGKWREAMVKEIKDIRRIQDLIKEPRKYNEAVLEMLEYFKCLEKNGLLPMG
ncbi:single-stranded DNA-binding protein [Ralstonia solanacearum]|nr:single-stranded DNA-binding protein [Ralstonia solanacearum]